MDHTWAAGALEAPGVMRRDEPAIPRFDAWAAATSELRLYVT